MPLTRILLALALALVATAASAQNTTRRNLKPRKTESVAVADSSASTLAKVRLSGFEKAQRSNTESLFVTNGTDSRISSVTLTLTYFDEKGRQIHERTLTLSCSVPAGETRCLSFKSWDRQQLWYYVRSQGRHNDYSTPFDVKARLLRVVSVPPPNDSAH